MYAKRFRRRTLSSQRFMYLERSKFVCIPIVKCEVLGPQHSLSLMSYLGEM